MWRLTPVSLLPGGLCPMAVTIAHLASSSFFGGPERQMLEGALSLPASYRTEFILFRDRGKSQDFLARLRDRGLATQVLDCDTPNLPGMATDLERRLRAIS